MIPSISVIVPCRNERENIETCIRSVLEQETPPGGFEVIVADGMSDDGTRKILNQLTEHDSCLRIVDNPDRGIASGLNAAIRAARGKIIVRMDAHTKYAPDYLRQSLAVLQETRASNVGGPARTTSNGYVQAAVCAAYHSPFSVGGARFHNLTYEGYVDTVTYGCWHREVFDRIGFFDEEFVRNEDDEFNLRLIRSGGKVWQSPQIKSWYRPRGSLGELFRQYMQYGYWKVRVIQKHKLPASGRHLVPSLFVLSSVFLGAASLWSHIALFGLIGLTAAYLLGNVVASVIAAARTEWRLLPILPLVFACYHFGYGYGFLRGLVDFVVLRRQPTRAYTRLTRASMDDSV
jgi:glycosyltransferase involved in cell wall biosynthesis